MGGDEFSVILQNGDFKKRDELIKLFHDKSAELSASSGAPSKQISTGMGMAVYDREKDSSVGDVVRRADKLMYKDKYEQKHNEN